MLQFCDSIHFMISCIFFRKSIVFYLFASTLWDNHDKETIILMTNCNYLIYNLVILINIQQNY